jgi:hypothetical protein
MQRVKNGFIHRYIWQFLFYHISAQESSAKKSQSQKSAAPAFAFVGLPRLAGKPRNDR